MASSQAETPDLQLTPFGAPMLKHFMFAEGYKNFNHGAYGTHPRFIQDAQRRFQSEAEASPDIFMSRTRPVQLDKAREAVAKLLNVSRKECVFVRNATTGIDTVLRNLVFKEGDIIVYFATVHGGVENAIVYMTQTTPVRVVKVQYQLPISHEEIVRRFRDAVTKAKEVDGLNVRVAVFDTIVSQPAVRFPFERLIEACREEEILSVVDGAHAIGQIALDLGKLRPDFFVSNCYKWLYTPRGCAVLYVPIRNQHLIRTTLPTSWILIPAGNSTNAPQSTTTTPMMGDKTAFETLFEQTAAADDSAYFTVPAAIHFRQIVCGGEERIYKYLEKLAVEGGDTIAAKLGTEVLQEEPDLKPGETSQLRRCAMSCVRLPLAYYTAQTNSSSSRDNSSSRKKEYRYPPPLSPTELSAAISFMYSVLINEYNTVVPLIPYAGHIWTRVCAQIYLQKSDFVWLGGVLEGLCERVGRREFSRGRGEGEKEGEGEGKIKGRL